MLTSKEINDNTLFKYLDTAASIFLVINPNQTVKLVNKKGCEVLGYVREEIEGKNWFDCFIPSEKRDELKAYFDDVIHELVEPPDSYENEVLVRHGEPKLIKWRNSLLKDASGKVTGLISSGADITAEARANDTLFLRNRALEVAGNGIIIADAKDSNLPIIYSNPAFSRLTGYKRSDVIGRNCRFLQNDDRDQDAIVTMAKALQKGSGCKVVLRNYRKDGSLFWNELAITPLYDEDQELTHFIGVQNDVTEIQLTKKLLQDYVNRLEDKVEERTKEIETTVQKLVETNLDLEDQITSTKRAEIKAQESQALALAIAQNFPNGIIIVFDSDLRLIYVEGEELQNIDLKKSDFEGKYIDDLPIFSKNQKSRIKNDVLKTLEGHSVSFEIDYQDRCYAVNSTPLHSKENGISGALFVYNNVTEQKEVQQELEKALKIEQELNELKSRFISMASHEFRTPLSAILSSAILIGKQNEPGKEERREKHVTRIKANVKNLVVILNDFLSLSKLEEGKVRVDPQQFELTDFVGQLVEEMGTNIKEGQSIQLKLPKNVISVFLDPKLLSHILTNLLSNASKYSDENQDVVLELHQEKKTIEFRVSDKGIGIPTKEQKNLFERFFRAENVTNIQGTGLGLHIVKQYTELMKGNVAFESEEGKGSTFIITLPINL